jgi:hypothetical protein
MGFQEPRDAISICNKALSRIKQQPLAGSLDDPANLNKHAARECKLWYKTIVRQVLSQHHWGLATKRTALVTNVTNVRDGEWAYSYVPPSDMAFPVVVQPPYSAIGGTISYYRGLGALLAQLYGRPLFRYESGAIFANAEGAILDYTSFDITEQDFNEAVEALVVLYLASQLAYSVAKDDKLGRDLHEEALARQNLEIAHNLNMNQPKYGDFVSEGERARAGLYPDGLDLGLTY